ncbi:MAG: type II toxin-antitoxin system Phd/YefM family antitoxin [Planctomycetaceae bacterium]|nr:type II toxin-antitoxin system Phd/YefM family antitoxin [Planctomycetaceae bacterium]
MKAINVHRAKTQLSSLLADVEKKHEKFLICRNGKPVAELSPHVRRSRLKTDPVLRRVKVKCDLTEPMTDWEEE